MSCACHGGFAGSDDAAKPVRFLRTEKVLAKFIAQEMRAGRSFYITDVLNSTALRGVNPDDIVAMFSNHPDAGGLGFLQFLIPIFTAITGAAATVGTAALAAAPSIATIAGSVASIKAISAAKGVALPPQVAAPAVTAAHQDILANTGITPTMLLIGGGILLLTMTMGRR